MTEMPPEVAHAHLSPDQVACAKCGRGFIKRRPWARFCSDGCKNVFAKEKAAADERDAERYRALRSGEIYRVAGIYVANGAEDWKSVEGERLDELVDRGIAGIRHG